MDDNFPAVFPSRTGPKQSQEARTLSLPRSPQDHLRGFILFMGYHHLSSLVTWCSYCLWFGQWEPLRVALCPLTCHHRSGSSPYYSAQSDIPGSSRTFPTPALPVLISLRSSRSFYWRMVFINQSVYKVCSLQPEHVISGPSQWTELGSRCTLCTHICMYVYKYIYIHTHAHSLIYPDLPLLSPLLFTNLPIQSMPVPTVPAQQNCGLFYFRSFLRS